MKTLYEVLTGAFYVILFFPVVAYVAALDAYKEIRTSIRADGFFEGSEIEGSENIKRNQW